MKLLEDILRKINQEVTAQAVASLKSQNPDRPELHLGKSIGMQNGLMRSLELIRKAVDEERKNEIMAE